MMFYDSCCVVNENGVKHEKVHPRFRFSDSVSVKEREKVWVEVECLTDISKALETYQNRTSREMKLVVCNTAAGYYKNIKPDVYVDISKANHSFELQDSLVLFHQSPFEY